MIQRHDYGGNCWWCGKLADPREHKYKKADIKTLFGKGAYKNDDAQDLLRIRLVRPCTTA